MASGANAVGSGGWVPLVPSFIPLSPMLASGAACALRAFQNRAPLVSMHGSARLRLPSKISAASSVGRAPLGVAYGLLGWLLTCLKGKPP